MNRIAFATLLVSTLAFADGAGGLGWTPPAKWTSEPGRPMRAATYKIAPAKGDADPAECAVFYFGQGQGGSVDDNLRRWYGQFTQPDGKSTEAAAKKSQEKVGGLNVTKVDVSGTYAASMGPMMAQGAPKPGYRMLAAIVEGPEGPLFFKLTGPAKTIEGAKGEFEKLLKSIKAGAK